jgi:hypothetical protein
MRTWVRNQVDGGSAVIAGGLDFWLKRVANEKESEPLRIGKDSDGNEIWHQSCCGFRTQITRKHWLSRLEALLVLLRIAHHHERLRGSKRRTTNVATGYLRPDNPSQSPHGCA